MTVADQYLTTINQKYGQVTQSVAVQNILKESIDIGTAVVKILGATGIAGFKFNIPQREQIKLHNEVTDHYVDTNRPLQDHIAARPVSITLQGLQGDYFYSVNQIEDTLAKVVPTMALVKQFLPKLSAATMQIKSAYNKKALDLSFAKDIYNQGLSVGDKLGLGFKVLNETDVFAIFQQLYKLKSPQTRAFFFFESLANSKAIFSVESTYKRYDYMVITDIQALRDENADITDFTLTFKQINVTASLVRDLNNAAGRTRQQLAEIVNKGVDRGKKVEGV